jgi:hypothetical protein
MTVTPTKRLIILILGITTNLSLGNMPSASAKNADNKPHLILLQNHFSIDNSILSNDDFCKKLNFSETSKMGSFLKTTPYIKTTNIFIK